MLYDEFINNILNTRGRHGCGDEYYEEHHILPRCMGGRNEEDNLIDLFAREHFIAHKLLAQENTNNHKLVYAYWMMAHCYRKNDMQRYECTPEEYEEAKIVASVALSKLHKGKKISDKQKEIISQKMSGVNHPLYGKHHSEESIKKMREHRPNQFGDNNPNFGNCWTQKQKDNMSLQRRGENNPKAFEVYCPELDERFWGSKEAADKYNIKASNISACIHGRQKTAGKHPVTGEKLHWVKVENKDC